MIEQERLKDTMDEMVVSMDNIRNSDNPTMDTFVNAWFKQTAKIMQALYVKLEKHEAHVDVVFSDSVDDVEDTEALSREKEIDNILWDLAEDSYDYDGENTCTCIYCRRSVTGDDPKNHNIAHVHSCIVARARRLLKLYCVEGT